MLRLAKKKERQKEGERKKERKKKIFLWHFHPMMPNSQRLASLGKSLQLHLTPALYDHTEQGRISVSPGRTHMDIAEADI